MVIFITSYEGYKECEKALINLNHPIWVTKDTLSKDKIIKLRKQGVAMTVFEENYDTNNKNELDFAIQIIKEHHPDKIIWVQHNSKTTH